MDRTQGSKAQSCIKGTASSFSLCWKHLGNQVLAAAVEGQPDCPVHWSQKSVLFGSCCATCRSHPDGRRRTRVSSSGHLLRAEEEIEKSVLCSSKRFIRPFILDTKSALFECESSPCWLVCQGRGGGRPDPGLGDG